ncbi:unnamed protein product [Lactuca saligna]|uniref:Glucan endo-1,3-beta-D-glucosidase n=1 Tax=Lactuca saligna TaxID=75948 RepID=A0AA35VHP6_LACSI|nr:unnamed protein product [Lactuca saligna]
MATAPQLLLLGLFISLLIFTDTQAQQIGVCNGRLGNNLPSEEATVNFYQRNGITRMRIYDPNPATLRALQRTNIELILDVPNRELESLTNPSNARTWVQNHIQNYPEVKFRYIAVGNEVNPNDGSSQLVKFVLPAMRNVHQALVDAGLDNKIKVSTATYSALLENSYPPSEGVFYKNVADKFIGPIITFLAQNNLPMLANIYPYFACQLSADVNLEYSLFTSGPLVPDKGLMYSNLFDAMYDAHYAAQARLGGENVEIVVSESGWPSAGHRVATPQNAGTYYRKLIEHVKLGRGTPARPGRYIEVYLFAMFDENSKTGDDGERNFGLFYPDQRSKYQLGF